MAGNNNVVQQVFVVNPQQIGSGGGGGGGNVNIISSIALDVNVLNPCISICQPIDVNVTGITGGTSVPTYNEITSIPFGILTTIATYVVPAGKTFYPAGFVSSGTVNAWFKLQINSITYLSARSTVAEQTVLPSFMGAPPAVAAGQTVELKVIYQTIGLLADFEGTILGVIL